jgi:hypothetical protein
VSAALKSRGSAAVNPTAINAKVTIGKLGCPAEHLEFHLWYLKEKGWIKRTESGTLAITVEGVDRANSEHQRDPRHKLLTVKHQTG